MYHLRGLGLAVYAAVLVAVLVAFPAVSHADSLTFELTSDHCSGGGGCGPQTPSFGEVVVSDNGAGQLSFHVTMFNGNTFVNTGFDLTFAYNLTGNPTVTYSGLTSGWQIPNAISGNQQAAGSYSQDGTGTFEYGVLWGQQGGGHGTSGPLDFNISATGLTLASLEQNSDGQFFAVDILSGTTGKTGNVDASAAVPEPSTLLLMGTALLGIGYSVRNRSFRRVKGLSAVS